jgi:hypothetical protein
MNRTATALVLCALLLGCEPGTPSNGCEADPGTFYVDASRAKGLGDNACDGGSLAAALASGRKVVELVSDLTATETLKIPVGVTLQGRASGVLLKIRCPQADCVRFEGGGTLRRLELTGGGKNGVVATVGAVNIEDAKISGMKGDGLHVEGAVGILVQKTAIIDNAGRGIYAKGIGSLSVIDPVYAPKPFDATGKLGVIDPVYSPASVISGNGQGGIAVIDPVYSPKADKYADAILVQSTLLKGNGRYGIGVWGSALKLANSAILDTKVNASGPWADGLLVAKGNQPHEPAMILVQDDTVIDGSGRTGILVTYDTDVKIDGRVQNSGLGGVWVHGAKSKVTLSKTAVIFGNRAVGVVATKGADLQVEGATIAASVLHKVSKETEMGDGVGVYNGARATIRNAKLLDNARAAIVVHSAKQNAQGEADVVVEGCEMHGSQHTFVINGAPVPLSATADKNDAESSASKGSSGGGSSGGSAAKSSGYSDNASLPVQTGYCDGEDLDESGECVSTP